MTDILKVFIGFDPRQMISYTTLANSILLRSSVPVSITALVIEQLPIKRQGLTPFTYSRFLVPHLCNYEGWGLFLDADMLLVDDIAKLFALKNDDYAVMVRKHPEKKFEWASVMLFNNAQCSHLTPEYVETANHLHTIGFVDSEKIGNLPARWNHLVGYDDPTNDVSLIHYTQGVPVWEETINCEHANIYNYHMDLALSADSSWDELMGNSVHAGMDSTGKKWPLYRFKEMEDAQTTNVG